MLIYQTGILMELAILNVVLVIKLKLVIQLKISIYVMNKLINVIERFDFPNLTFKNIQLFISLESLKTLNLHY